ncbi:hypothetical protein M0813_15256 [Anaeramoeba flamelloides]|uniref:Uncharacterized protein n=1 Tax=Anaeramoeba flamelloides TaxID=1746091 RepID=A0ABQ8Z305_9EUKA|nr:hypothetical protein M0813_15256 [Anaeramoeba flamelloides]
MSSSLPINCINADLLKIIFQKFNHQSSEKKFSKQRAEVVELRLRKDWNRIYTELVDEGHWNPNKNKRKRIKGNDLNNNSQDIVLSNITNMGNNSCSKPRVGNIENKFQTPSFKSVVYPQRKEKLLKEKEVDKKDNKEKINKSFDILRSRGYKCDESIHYEINSVDDENDKSSLENKKTSDKKINEGILLCDLKKHTTQEIIKKYEKHIDGLLESQKELSKKMSDFSILLTKKIESINKTQNQILDHFEKYQAGTKCLDQNKKTIFDLTFIENLTNNTLKQTHEMTKRSLLKIKAKRWIQYSQAATTQ